MLSVIENIPNLKKDPLNYVFEDLNIQHNPNTLWLEFGVFSGKTINYISSFTNKTVYGFDSFLGLPETWRTGFEKGTFNTNGNIPIVNNNVQLIKGWFNDTLEPFIETEIIKNNQKVSFIHLDADLYSSTKYVLNSLKNHLTVDCVIVFDELVNFPGFCSETSELKAFYEFVIENNVKYSWVGMNGYVGMDNSNKYNNNENVAVIIHSLN